MTIMMQSTRPHTFTRPPSLLQSDVVQQAVYSQLWTGHKPYSSSCMCHVSRHPSFCPFGRSCLKQIGSTIAEVDMTRHKWVIRYSKNSQHTVISARNYATQVPRACDNNYQAKGVDKVHSLLSFIAAEFHVRSSCILWLWLSFPRVILVVVSKSVHQRIYGSIPG